MSEVDKVGEQVSTDAPAAPPGTTNGIPDFVGAIDLGSDTSVVAKISTRSLKSEILRNDMSNQVTPMVISFAGTQRCFGEVAAQMKTTNKDKTVESILSYLDVFHREEPEAFNPLIGTFQDENGRMMYRVDYGDTMITLRPEQLLGAMLAKLASFVQESESTEGTIPLAIVVPDFFNANQRQAIRDAAVIAGINLKELVLRSEAAAMDYGTKRSAETLGNSVMLIVDVGHSYTTAVAYKWDGKKGTKLAASGGAFGAADVDEALFQALAQECQERTKVEVKRGSKGAIRLMNQVRKLKESLSAVPEASVTVESLVEDRDMSFSFTREKLENLCKNVREKVTALVHMVLDQIVDEETRNQLSICELIGGGMRIPMIKDAIQEAVGPNTNLSYTMDSMAALVVGASLCCAKRFEPTTGLLRPAYENLAILDIKDEMDQNERHQGENVMTLDALEAAVKQQEEMIQEDERIAAVQNARNKLESKIYETRAIAGSSKPNVELIQKDACFATLDKFEDWLYDEGSSADCTKETYDNKMAELDEELKASCGEYFAKVEAERLKLEQEMEEAAKKAKEELEASGGKEDHDFRKLKKPERMRKVMLNKEEGNTLFKDGNFEAANLRYIRALQHCDKFFDLNEEDKKEVAEVTLSLHLNCAQCNIKLQKWPDAIKSSQEALKIDDKSTKALYRLAFAQENTKKFREAKANLLKAKELEPEDKAIARLLERVLLQIKREEAKQKKMAQKMFGA